MYDITHRYTEAPWYRKDTPLNQHDKYHRDWNYGDIDHTVSPAGEREKLHPVVFDVETDATTPQNPIIVTIYDSKYDALFLAWEGEDVNPQGAAESARQAFEARNIPVETVETVGFTKRLVEEMVIRQASEDDRVLVGHNVAFDLWMCGDENDDILDSGHGQEWETATEYRNLTMLTKRAGAFGRMYEFRQPKPFKQVPTQVADTQTVAKSVWLKSSLGGAIEGLRSDGHDIRPVSEAEEHGKLTEEYIGYNADDVAATYELYLALRKRLWDAFGTQVGPERIYSTASIFKDVLRRMNFDRVHYDKSTLDIVAPAYFGGRTEAVECGEVLSGMTLVDFLSQYPTVSELSDVWRFMQSKRVVHHEIEPNELPDVSDVSELSDPDMWERCADYYVELDSDGSTLPVRTKLPDTDTTKVYNARVHHSEGETTMHHFYDYLSSALVSENPPEIVSAYRVMDIGKQSLEDTYVGGTKIEGEDNILKRCIEERKEIANSEGKGPSTQALKITANSGYGVSAERIVDDLLGGIQYDKHDVAGKFYNPHVAATITAGGRLMLAMGEAAAEKEGGKMWYCDTDSLLLSDSVASTVQNYFEDLNPYDGHAGTLPVLEIEDTEIDGEETKLIGMDVYVVGEKKYAMLMDGELVKYTEHGLGHYKELRDTGEHPERVANFWRSLLRFQGVHVDGEELSVDELRTPVTIQMSASTRNMRETVSGLVDEGVNYGDWLQITMPNDDATARYVGIDLDSQVIKVGGSGTEVVDEVDPDNLKEIGMVRNEWARKSMTDNHLPDVRIVDQEVVTKESVSVELEIFGQIDEALARVDFGLIFD